jgi:GNAT superfamily N-acetyltransferase
MPLFRELMWEAVITPPGLVHWLEGQPERAAMRAWVAEAEGEIVAFANGRLRWALEEEGIAGLWVGVLPPFRRRGLGTALHELADGHLRDRGAHRLESTIVDGDEPGRRFAERRGYRATRREQYWSLDVGAGDTAQPTTPDGVTVVRLAHVRDRERELFDLYSSAERDMPDDHTPSIAFDEWQEETLGNPELDLEVSAVVLVDDSPASLAWLITDREGRRADNEMTGTHRAFRRRGLARLAKEATIAWAREAGIQTILTSNDSANADMLALNEHLGYRPTLVRIGVAKTL